MLFYGGFEIHPMLSICLTQQRLLNHNTAQQNMDHASVPRWLNGCFTNEKLFYITRLLALSLKGQKQIANLQRNVLTDLVHFAVYLPKVNNERKCIDLEVSSLFLSFLWES